MQFSQCFSSIDEKFFNNHFDYSTCTCKTFLHIFGYEYNQTNINLLEKYLNLFLDLTYLPIWTEIQSMKQVLHGPNSIDVEVKPYVQILFEEVLNPFYIFQIGSITLWSLDSYYYYASCIAFISLISIIGKSIF